MLVNRFNQLSLKLLVLIVFLGGVTGLWFLQNADSVLAVSGCSSPTVITGGGSYALAAGDNCFKYVNSTFTRGAMWSVMNPGDSTVSNTVQWYGGRNESTTACIADSQTLNGNGAQINNFTVGKDSTSAMYVSITANKANTVSMSIQNWQNGNGCSVAPTPISGGGGATNTPTNTQGGSTPTPTNTCACATVTRTNTPFPGSPTPTNTTCVCPTATRTNTPAVSNTPTNTAIGPTNTPTNTAIGPTPTRTNTPVPGTHLSNPFAGASWYVNPDWAASVNASGVSASKKSVISSQNTAVWLDSIGTLNGTNGARGLIGHLDHAVATGKNLIIIVVYDLPGRDCSALASNGELPGTAAGLQTYKTSYIDVIANAIGSKAAYANLRIVAVIEPDSLPNLVTNLSDPECSAINSNGLYVQGIQYAINKLHAFSNVYLYLDIGHAGWLGWPSNFGPAITLYKNVIKGTTAGGSSVDGFVDNTANNQVQTEPYMTANQMIGGNPVRSAFFFSWNDHIQEDTFDAAWKAAMTSGTDAIPASSANMLIDTARNGWGGCGGGPAISAPCRPTGPSTSTTLETFVNASRIDRRPAKGDWCNQNGAGLGERPTASPNNPVYQAFIWVKPPGESDGSSSLIPTGPDNPDGKGFDRMCDPTYGGNSLNQNQNTNALPNAPVSGRWFEAQFQQLAANAWPPIP
jgi:cellulose 1,4-beta-cellobiosidase